MLIAWRESELVNSREQLRHGLSVSLRPVYSISLQITSLAFIEQNNLYYLLYKGRRTE